MKNHIRTKESRGVLVAASAVAIAIVVAGAAGIAADSGTAASTAGSVKASQAKKVRFERPKLRHRVLTITGTKASEKIALRLRAHKPGILQVDVGDNGSADFSFKRNQVARIAVDARAGDDLVRIDERNGIFTNLIRTTIAGGAGNDSLVGGSGAETLLGGDGNDTVDGNGGNDRALMGAGDDTFVWDPGDGSDTIEGEAGADTMRFNGANVAEQVDLSANGNRLRFFRTQANITMDTAGVERVDFNALGGADLVAVNDLSGTDVTSLNVDLAGAPGGAPATGRPTRWWSTGAMATTRSTSAETPPLLPCRACGRWCRFGTRSRATSSSSAVAAATTRSRRPRSQRRRSP